MRISDGDLRCFQHDQYDVSSKKAYLRIEVFRFVFKKLIELSSCTLLNQTEIESKIESKTENRFGKWSENKIR